MRRSAWQPFPLQVAFGQTAAVKKLPTVMQRTNAFVAARVSAVMAKMAAVKQKAFAQTKPNK